MTAAFTVSQSAITPSNVTVTDTSTSITGTITQRRITVTDAYGDPLTGDGTVNYDEWALADTSITLEILSEDTAANILVEWLDVNDAVVESLDANYPLSEYGKQFLYYLVQLQGLTPGVYQDSNYSGNLAIFWANVIAGDNAVTYGNDIAAGQSCYNRENQMRLNESLYF